jgi:two-component system cell cycle response regulator DivK
MKGDREKILKTGCNDYISKPINVENFISTVRKYLDTRN